ncbi:TM2 domain-containing protein [Bacteroidota bacterium]
MANVLQILPELQGQEMGYIQEIIKDLDNEKAQLFANIYRARRRDPQLILITTILGFFVIAGVQRFLVNQIGMGLLYLFTAGLCLVGTIVDLVNYQKLAFDYNRMIADEVIQITKID